MFLFNNFQNNYPNMNFNPMNNPMINNMPNQMNFNMNIHNQMFNQMYQAQGQINNNSNNNNGNNNNNNNNGNIIGDDNSNNGNNNNGNNNKCSSEDEIKYEIYYNGYNSDIPSGQYYYIVPQNKTCVIIGYIPNPCSNFGLRFEKIEIKCDETIIYITDKPTNKTIKPTNRTSTKPPICIQIIIPLSIIIKFNRLPKNITVINDGHHYPYKENN